jgi:hypothetical protein
LVAEDLPTLRKSLEICRTVENAFTTASFDPWHSLDTTRIEQAKSTDKEVLK